MDFFAQQDQARRNSGVLVLLFVLAVLTLIAITNLLVVLTLWSLDGSYEGGIASLIYQDIGLLWARFDWQRFAVTGLGVSAVILAASGYKWRQLAEGGKRIAESLGGRRIHPNSDDDDEQRVLNVVAEMAIASGMPVPAVYLLEHEQGINAFAAGNTPADAVVGVTRGCIQQLNREQLQGVIAHEFSHILNGDMRLNLRLIAMLHGIVFIGSVGQWLLRFRPGSSSRRRSAAQLALLGFALVVIGWLGTFFGQLIKSSVSRQREFLADASAVQFTRNPQGIADALKVIGGHSYGAQLASPGAAEISHLFFGQSLKKLTGLFATHPPLLERIARIEPHWDGSYMYPRPSQVRQQQAQQRQADAERQRAEKQALINATILGTSIAGAGIDPAEFALQDDINVVHQGLMNIPQALRQQAREPLGAMALVFGLLVAGDDRVRGKQLGYLRQQPTPGLLPLLESTGEQLRSLPRSLQLPLLELTLPALKCMSAVQYRVFKDRLLLLMRADDRIDLYEWCLYQLLSHYLEPEFGGHKASTVKYHKPQRVSEAYRVVLSLLVHQGHSDDEQAQRAFNRGSGGAGLYMLTLLPPADCHLDAFKAAVGKLGCCSPALKARLIRGLELCVRQDGRITVEEREVLTAIAAAMDSPLPKLDG